MAEHLLRASIPIAIALSLLVVVCRRHDVGTRTMRRFFAFALVTLGLVAAISATSRETEVRCRHDPNEWCVINDSVPAMATVVFVFVMAALIRAWRVYDLR